MCNPRPNSFSDDESSVSTTPALFDVSKLTIATRRPRSGRKGDPRMHRALEARLTNPKASLLDALKKGGFEFHVIDNTWYDEDNILLSQRKNQLSRRVRLYKQSQQKYADAESSSEDATVKENTEDEEDDKDGGLKKEQKELKRRISSDSVKLNDRKAQKVKTTDDKEVTTQYCESTTATIISPPSSNAAMVSIPSTVMCSDFNIAPHPLLTPPSQMQHQHNCTHQSEPLSSSLCYEPDSISRQSNYDRQNEKFGKALKLFSLKSSELIKSCLELAGFNKDECEENGKIYSQFLEKVSMFEHERFMNTQRTPTLELSSGASSLSPFGDEAAAAMSVTTNGTASTDSFAPIGAFASSGRMGVAPNSDLSPNTRSRETSWNQIKQPALPNPCQTCPPALSNPSHGLNSGVNNAFSQFVWDSPTTLTHNHASNPFSASQPLNHLMHVGSMEPNVSYENERMTSVSESLSYPNIHGVNQINDHDVMVSICSSTQNQTFSMSTKIKYFLTFHLFTFTLNKPSSQYIQKLNTKKLMSVLEEDHQPSAMSSVCPKLFDLTTDSISNVIDDDELVNIVLKSSNDTA